MTSDITPHEFGNSTRAPVFWFTGLSGSGKSTLIDRISLKMTNAVKLDGDSFRSLVCSDLGFDNTSRNLNLERAAGVAKIISMSNVISLCAFVSPLINQRIKVREIVEESYFFEVHVSTPLEICESRDPKKLYEKARSGLIQEFTGISSPYEAPKAPWLSLDNSSNTIDENVNIFLQKLSQLNETALS